jgi:hypothetical protein
MSDLSQTTERMCSFIPVFSRARLYLKVLHVFRHTEPRVAASDAKTLETKPKITADSEAANEQFKSHVDWGTPLSAVKTTVVDENNDVAIPRWSIEIRDEPISCI